MPRRRRKRSAKNLALTHAARNRLTQAQREALIPGGAVNKHRARRDDIATEVRADTEQGEALITGQYVSTPVRKLHEARLITLEEVNAAQLFQSDHDIAYASCINPLAAVYIDSSRSGAASKGAMERKAFHGERFRRARLYLGNGLYRVALAGIVQSPEAGMGHTFTAIGATTLVGHGKERQRAGGQDALIRVCQELAIFYGGSPKRRRIDRNV